MVNTRFLFTELLVPFDTTKVDVYEVVFLAKKIFKHSLFARLTHWLNALMIILLAMTGLYIRDPGHFPFFASMDIARKIHFIAMYMLIFGVLIRLYYSLITKDIYEFLFRPRDMKLLPGVIKYYLFISNSLPKAGKYNPGQRIMYNFWFLMLLAQVVTGFMIYLPDSFGTYIRLAGGPGFVRQFHFMVAWLFIITVAGHVYLAITSGWSTVKSIIIGVKRNDNNNDSFFA